MEKAVKEAENNGSLGWHEKENYNGRKAKASS
jgi:hypothetical protein